MRLLWDVNALVSIVGPTGSGKSAMAVALAQRFGTAVVSADSVQMYRGMDIGSGKVTSEEMQGVPHLMLDCVEPDQVLSAADFAAQAEAHIAALHLQQPLVLTAGGSGFYLQALLEGLDEMPAIPALVREQVREEFATQGLAGLLAELAVADPESYQRIDLKNPVRVCRAVEVFRASGRPLSSWQKGRAGIVKPYRQLMLGLKVERQELNARIDRRVDGMIAAGWLQEVEGLLQRFPKDAPGLGSLGYREMVDYLEGKQNWADTVALIKLHTHQFAKRQMTWFQRQQGLVWFAPDAVQAVGDKIASWLEEG